MFVDLRDFITGLAVSQPAIGTVVWESQEQLPLALTRVEELLAELPGDRLIARLCANGYDRSRFQEELTLHLQAEEATRTWLLIHNIEELISAAGTILNGIREQLGRLQGVILFVRENRRQDLFDVCPDLVDWIGLREVRLRELASSQTVNDVRAAIAALAAKHDLDCGMAFLDQGSIARIRAEDLWLWNELWAIKTDLEQAEQ